MRAQAAGMKSTFQRARSVRLQMSPQIHETDSAGVRRSEEGVGPCEACLRAESSRCEASSFHATECHNRRERPEIRSDQRLSIITAVDR